MLKNLSTEAKILIGIGLITLVLLISGVFFLNQSEQKSSLPIDKAILVRSDSYKTGTGSEKVTIVEFADFQCPGCKAAHEPINKIATDYKGQVNVVYRNFPLAMHPHARDMAYFAEAAGQQGKFWEAYSKIFSMQDSWSSLSDIDPTIEKYSTELGLDYQKIKEVMSAEPTKNKIQRDYDDGIATGVNGTPTIFIDGEKLEVFPTYEILKQKVQEKLK